jgi:hypothetical protein
MSKIPTIFEVFISTVENLTGDPNEKVVVLIVEEIDLRVFFSKKYTGFPPDISYTVISVGSPELDTEKSTGSEIKKDIPFVDETVEFPLINKE